MCDGAAARLILVLSSAVLSAADSAVTFGDARFSFYSPALARFQLRAPGAAGWDLRASLSFANSALPPPAPVDVAVRFVGSDVVELRTSALLVAYNRSGAQFSAESLSVKLLAAPFSTWAPGVSEAGNLRGTRMDLGCYDTFENCYSGGLGWGPLSRDGWAAFDDVASLRMRPTGGIDGGPWWDGATQLLSDVFFFGHGLDFPAALRDFAAVSGGAPLPPAAAFGVWWSTWYDFSEAEFAHSFLPRPQVVDCFVVPRFNDMHEETGEVAAMVSFYHLPSSIMRHERHKTLHAAYLFYYFTLPAPGAAPGAAPSVPLRQLMEDGLICARNCGVEVLNCLDLMDNNSFLRDLKFGPGDGKLQYYLYNYASPELEPKEVGLILL